MCVRHYAYDFFAVSALISVVDFFQIEGNIVLVERGGCTFFEKVSCVCVREVLQAHVVVGVVVV